MFNLRVRRLKRQNQAKIIKKQYFYFRFLLWPYVHIMAILKSENKNTDLFMILAWLCRFNIRPKAKSNVFYYLDRNELFLRWLKLEVT